MKKIFFILIYSNISIFKSLLWTDNETKSVLYTARLIKNNNITKTRFRNIKIP